jgi:antitoxin HigA-1
MRRMSRLSITTDRAKAAIRRGDLHSVSFDDVAPGAALPPLSPGEVLLEEFMRPAGLTARGLAAELGVPGNRISAIVNGTRSITAATALKLAGRFGTSAELWMNLQSAHDLAVARDGSGEIAT